ncbi:MAG: cobyrinate a,c-diamide synthase [Clostridia bacterium]|nr:cobyrinate a,c-diamide synthase [Clostridia bacterium]
MTKSLPRVLIAGTSSGSGKTTAVCAILSLLKRRGIDVTSCKCGPDYIDPMFHKSVLGVDCTNLDPFFVDGNLLRYLLAENGGGMTVIEGVMGYYDGTGADGMENSTYSVARETHTPVVLVINGKGASSSLLAVIEGFLNFVPDSMICGVIFNNVTAMTFASLKRLTEARFGGLLKVIGYIPKLPEDCILGSRHLGLVTAGEIENLSEKLNKIADLCADTIDLDALIAVAESADVLDFTLPEIPRFEPVRIALAEDAAFCFVYRDNLSLLEKMGAEILPFSPLADEAVPDADGLLIPGGYPELYAEKLAANETTKSSVRAAIASGMPAIAECGGFQYLGAELDGYSMCGILSHESVNTGKLVRFGYVSLTSHRADIFGDAGTTLRGHEFHYWDSTDCGDSYTAVKTNRKTYDCVVSSETLYAGYPHLYLLSNIAAATEFYQKCLKFKEKNHDHSRPE